jgi:hypothetical protein
VSRQPTPLAGVYLAGIPIGQPLVSEELVHSPAGTAEPFEFVCYSLQLLAGKELLRVEYRDAGLCVEHLAQLQQGGTIPVTVHGRRDARAVYFHGRK